MLPHARDLHVFEALARRERRTRQHRLSQLSAHKLVLYARSLRHIGRGVGGASRRLHPQRANEDNHMDRHGDNSLSDGLGQFACGNQRRTYCAASAYEFGRAVKSTARALATPIVTAKATTAITRCFMGILLVG